MIMMQLYQKSKFNFIIIFIITHFLSNNHSLKVSILYTDKNKIYNIIKFIIKK